MDLEQLELERQKVKSKAGRLLIIGVIFMILGIVLIACVDGMVIIFGLPLAIIGVILFVCGQSKKGKFSKKYKEAVVSTLVKEELGAEAIYNANGMIPLNQILYPGFVQKPDRHNGEDYIKAKYEDVDFEMCDINLQERVRHTDSKGNVHYTYETYFKGRYFIFDFNKEMNKLLYVMPGRSKPRCKYDLKLVETESIEFNKVFNSYSLIPEDVFYLLTPKMIQSMLELQKLYKGRQYYAFIEGKLYVAINNNKDSLEVNINKPINSEALKVTRSELRIAPAIINEFGINKSKFTVMDYEKEPVNLNEDEDNAKEAI